MALNKGIWDPTLRGTNIKGTNLKSLSFYKEQDALRLAKGAFAVYPGWFLQAQVLLERAGLWRVRRIPDAQKQNMTSSGEPTGRNQAASNS